MFTELTFGSGENGKFGLAWDTLTVRGPYYNALVTNVVDISIRGVHGLVLPLVGRI